MKVDQDDPEQMKQLCSDLLGSLISANAICDLVAKIYPEFIAELPGWEHTKKAREDVLKQAKEALVSIPLPKTTP